MKGLFRMTAAFLCAVLLFPLAVNAAKGAFAQAPVNAPVAQVDEGGDPAAGAAGDEEEDVGAPALVLADLPVSLSVGSRITLKAEPKNFKTPPESIRWTSGNPGVATVDQNGVVHCAAVGQTTITAAAEDEGTPVSASCVVNVTARRRLAHFFLSLNYKYSAMGDYFYSNNNFTWQQPFGFMRLYDVASQLIGYQYDFKRIVFTYDNKDWLVELWKGQYALFQYGGEIGVYTKYSTGFGDTPVSTYSCASRNDWLDMEMTLYQEQPDGTMRPVFTRDYDKYWWCDGYRVGRLRKSKPASELRMVCHITLKDERMAAGFVKGMRDIGFSQAESLDQLKDDCYFRDGADVYYIWRNLTDSQHLIPMFVDGDSLSVIASFFEKLLFSGRS
ncbi:MAG: DUF4474 domain-containing protein [Clostridia bacterium]|nr:DUF4474 domain-containing protein [Clostridia bacterium]